MKTALKLTGTLKFKGSGEGNSGADGIEFTGVELETNRRITVKDCTEKFIRSCSTEDCSVGTGSWGESNVEMKKEGYVYFMNSGEEDNFRIMTTYKGLVAELLQKVEEGEFSETIKRDSKTVTRIFTYDLYAACEECEKDEDEDEDEDKKDKYWQDRNTAEAKRQAELVEAMKEILRLHALWVKRDPAGKQADLSGADLRGAKLSGAILTDAKLSGAILTDANLTDANLTDANLTGADLSGAILTRVDLTGANLTDANLIGANLQGVDLKGENLRGVCLTRADLRGADLTNADLTNANLSGANLSGANLSGAHLTGAILTQTNLTGAFIYGADLRGADLIGANLFGADLTGANMTGAKLEGPP